MRIGSAGGGEGPGRTPRLLALFAMLLLATPAAGLAAVPGARGAAAPDVVGLDGVAVRLPAGGQQVITVRHTRGYHARVSFWRYAAGRWHRRWTTGEGRIGYGGLVSPTRRRQGSGMTPLGTVRLIGSFGTHVRRPGWDLSYRRTRPEDYWVEDNRSPFYNRYRARSAGGFRWWLPVQDANGSERLRAYPRQYEFVVVTSYNALTPVRHRGAGIFLHVNGRGATAGCVSVPRRLMVDVMGRLDPSYHPVMAVGR